MDKLITDHRPQTKLQLVVCGLQSAVCIFMLGLFPIAGFAATGTSDAAVKAAATTANVTAKTAAAAVPAKSPAKVAANPAESKKMFPGPQTKVKKTWEEKLPDLDPELEKLEGEEKSYQGIVTGAGFNGIAVSAQKLRADAPDEMWFDYVKGLRLSGVSRLAELQMGDTVKVSYKVTQDGRRFSKGITLVRKAPVVPEAPAAEDSEEEKE